MFSDLVGLTGLSARLDPEDMRDLLAECRNTIADPMAQFEGHIAGHLGGGVLDCFGYPHAHERDAERAVSAGLAAVAAIALYREMEMSAWLDRAEAVARQPD